MKSQGISQENLIIWKKSWKSKVLSKYEVI